MTGITYRNPAMLAKMASTLDVTSRCYDCTQAGRRLGEEAFLFGYDFPSVKGAWIAWRRTHLAQGMFRGGAALDGHTQRQQDHQRLDAGQPGGPQSGLKRRVDSALARLAAKYADITTGSRWACRR